MRKYKSADSKARTGAPRGLQWAHPAPTLKASAEPVGRAERDSTCSPETLTMYAIEPQSARPPHPLADDSAVNPKPSDFETDESRWAAVVRRDRSADGQFYYSVITTGVYCRPSCAARLARRQNVSFHATQQDALRAGFRPCSQMRWISLSRRRTDSRSAHGSGGATAAACPHSKLVRGTSWS